jgi:hypothetical protein
MKSRVVMHFRPTLAEFAFAIMQILLPRGDTEIVPAPGLFPPYMTAYDGRGIRALHHS